jgi:hypothetical protein
MRPCPLWSLLFLLVFAAPTAGLACPSPSGRATELVLPAAPARAYAADVIAGGRVALEGCGPAGATGRVTPEPDFRLDLSRLAPGRPVELRTRGTCDTVLLVTGADGGWQFDDDGAGEGDARLALTGGAAAPYHVWIGTYGPGSCKASLIVQAKG